MKHKLSITLILLTMFIVTQLIGIYVINTSDSQGLPFGLDEETSGAEPNFISILFALVVAFVLFSLIMKYDLKLVVRIWFFIVVTIALSVSINTFLYGLVEASAKAALFIAILFAFFKIIKPNIIVHNFTELLIYPGVAVILIPILSVYSIIVLLIIIAIYDAWAVWKSGIMQKMAKYQMQEVKIFGGFLIPTMDKKTREKIRQIKQKYKGKTIPASIKKKKFKVNLAILGGGDVVFPIITMGVFMRAYPEQVLFGVPGLVPALFILGGALLSLTYLFATTKKDKAYPAMPYITTGIFAGLLFWKLLI